MAELDRQVGASSDDGRGYWTGADWVFETDSVHQNAGYSTSSTAKIGGGMRFTNITIPKGAIITSAYITFTASATRAGTVCRTKIRGEDADNPSAFSDYSDYSGRPRTSAEVNWDGIAPWTKDSEYNSPEIKTIIQEIIDREGWASGNALVLFWDDHEDRSDHNADTWRGGQSYDGDSAKTSKLHIEYTPPAAGGARSHGYIMG
jgi:type IV pilus assembly protein PilY1